METSESTPNALAVKTYGLPPPTKAYQQAVGSPVYRLSELMFGSLLASYVLGFIGFAAISSNPVVSLSSGEVLHSWEQANFLWDQILLRAPFFFISITYAYVTAGLYVSYHAGILTMHHMPLEHLSFDFALALSQALLFGISMLYPMAFPFWLGVTLLFAALRQFQEHGQLVESFYRNLAGGATNKADVRTRRSRERQALKKFKKSFGQILKNEKDKYSLLSGWKPVPITLVLSAVALMALSAIGWKLVMWGFVKMYVVFYLSIFTCLVVMIYVHFVLGKRASLLYSEMAETDRQSDTARTDEERETSSIDIQFYELLKALKSDPNAPSNS